MPAIINSVEKFSIAEELELQQGDEVLSIDEMEMKDLIDYNFYCKTDFLTLKIKKLDGINITKRYSAYIHYYDTNILSRKSVKTNENYAQYDEKTKKDELNNIKHTPNIMPKMFEKSESTELEDNDLLSVPEQKIEPPADNDDKE